MSGDLAPEMVESARSLLETRADAGEDDLFGAERVDITLDGHGNGPFKVRKRDFEFVVDEPAERAGRDTAPNPLAFFLGGAATCFLSHFMLHSLAGEIRIDDLKLSARGYFNRRLVGGYFTRVVYDLRVESEISPDAFERVVRDAEKSCYAHNTLVRAGVDITTKASLNGSTVVELIADTSHL